MVEVRLSVDGPPLHFLPGQYVDLVLPGVRRSYSMISSSDQPEIVLLVAMTPNGAITPWLETVKPGADVRVAGPYGDFVLRPLTRAVTFVAGGSGLAPLLAMLRDIDAGGTMPHAVTLLFGVGSAADIVYAAELDDIADRQPAFSWRVAVGDAQAAHGQRVVTDLLHADLIRGRDVYACGPAAMTEAVHERFAALDAHPVNLYLEDFLPRQPTGRPESAAAGTSGGGRGRQRGESAQITVSPKGPLIVRGPVRVQLPDGTPVPGQRPTMALCRCGQSQTKPFCDGTHKQVGFTG